MPATLQPSPSLYTFGSMSLGRDLDRVRQDIAVARMAMDAGVWFHSSPTYNQGFTFMVLRRAFDEDRAHQPRLIVKLRDGTPELLRFEAEDTCRRLGIEGIDVAQLVSMSPGPGSLAEQLVQGGAIADELASLRARGLIRQSVVYIDPRNDAAGLAATGSPLVQGLTLYWNALQRNCSAAVWEAARQKSLPVIAIRTLAGGPCDERSAAARAAVQDLLREAGCSDEVEFALRLVASVPHVRTTIGGTASAEHLARYLACANGAPPLPADILARLDATRQ